MEITVKRLGPADLKTARRVFSLMAEVFEEEREPLSDGYLEALLRRTSFWGLVAFSGAEVLGGLTAHVIPMTRSESSELLLYDIAVAIEHQRRGVGRHLLSELLTLTSQEGTSEAFVLVDVEDTAALDFYRRSGGKPASVKLFSFTAESLPS